MELGQSYSQNLVQQVPWISQTMNSSFDLFKLTSEKDQSLSECQAGSLNELCGDLSSMPSLFGTGFAFQNNFNSPSTSFRSAFEAKVIHESLKVIPIYHEVLWFKSQEITKNSKSEAESISLVASKLAGDYQSNNMILMSSIILCVL